MIEWYQHIFMPCFAHAAASSFMTSRLNGVDMMSQSVWAESNKQNPS